MIKSTREVVSTSKVLWSARPSTAKRLKPLRSSFQSERSYEKIRGTVVVIGVQRLQRSISATVNGDCSTSPLCQHPAYGTGWQRSRRCSTTQHLSDGRSRLKTEENYEVVRTSPHSFTGLHSLQIATLIFTEPANSLYIVVYWLIVYLVIILITEKYWKDAW